MQEAFKTFRIGETRFLAFPWDSNVFVIDQDGNSFGAWFSIDNFAKHYRDKMHPVVSVGKAKLSFKVVT